MSWFKVSDGLAFHRKALAAGNEALGAWVRAGSWSSAPDNLTDGFIPPEVAAAIAPPKVWAKLRAAGLVDAPEGRDGQQLHDFLAYNPSAESKARDRETTRQRVESWRNNRRGNAGGNAVTPPIGNGGGTGAPSRPVPSQIPPTPQGGQAPPPAGAGGSPAKESKQDKPEERYRRAFAAGVLAGAPGVPYSLGGRLGLPFLQGLTTHSRGLRGEELETWITSTVSRWRRTADGRYQAGWSPAAFLRWLNGPDSGALELAPAGDRPRTRIAPPPPSPVVGAR